MPKLAPYTKTLSYSYAPGLFPSHALLDARPALARRLLVHSQAADSEGVAALRRRCQALGIRAETADHALARISRKDNCYAAIVFEKAEQPLSPDAPHVVLHQPADMGNLGTIARACVGFGLTSLALIRPAADVFDPRVVRASMGALFALDLMYFDSFDAYRSRYPGHALYPFMLDGSITLREAVSAPQVPYALIFGNEAAGLPGDFAQMGTPTRIPHGSGIDSLNLAMAVSIAAYAFTEKNFQEDNHYAEQ